MALEGMPPITADDALAILEMVLDCDRLTTVQEIVFRHAWQGKSYQEMAKVTDYESDYLKDVGSKLWKKLSKAFGEKVKKDNLPAVIKRYLKQHTITVNKHHIIEINLSGATINGENIKGNNTLGHFQDARFYLNPAERLDFDENTNSIPVSNIKQLSKPDESLDSLSIIDPQDNNLPCRSDAAVQIANTLDKAGIVFSPTYIVRVTTSTRKHTVEFDFLIFYYGQLGILQIEDDMQPNMLKNKEMQETVAEILSQGIKIIRHYDANLCREHPEQVVADFLQILIRGENTIP
ncbi:MAG TPA: hypothetical protein IGS52_01205 [Oscillatoriaceae cyanobacterium M33_DOE_052]|uniref:vWA-MoxR associated protein N-terminal HTH domain-containing protein n=1 Tax=Planktothricoides sp. SpSt-374 TaxID=2282167 RepID=A0A7C3VI19_9CYAN|nr:hypothetical protein [Oscillatoriaceae cyanobacterium M33_DOE_052]